MTPLPIELICNVTGTAVWRVNDTSYNLTDLTNGSLSGHSRNGTNILVNSPVKNNNTEYICMSQYRNGNISSDPAYIIIAGEYLDISIILYTSSTYVPTMQVYLKYFLAFLLQHFMPVNNAEATVQLNLTHSPLLTPYGVSYL